MKVPARGGGSGRAGEPSTHIRRDSSVPYRHMPRSSMPEEYVDMLQAGIVDPVKVVRAALRDAASVAGLLITTEAMVAEAPKKESASAMPGGGGMGGMGGMDF
jgi:hypothetical protein